MSCTRDILDPDHISDLRRFTQSRVLLAFDYDGTLAPIAPLPDAAHLPPPTRSLLVNMATRYPLVVISGRALVDISARVAGIGVREVFGNHGLERSGVASQPRAQVRSWVRLLTEQLAEQPGVLVEDKLHSLSVHYRAAPDHEQALQSILPVVRTLPDVRVICGAAAVNLLPRDDANKGVALRRALEASGCDRAIYVGDDETDEDAFAALPGDILLSIRIGSSMASQAGYHLDSQESIDLLLRVLINERNDWAGAAAR